jgi:uncharacterized protein (DUF486 family)
VPDERAEGLTLPPGTGVTMRNFMVAAIIMGFALYGALKMGSAYLTGTCLLVLVCFGIWFFSRMRHATLLSTAGPSVTDEMRQAAANPVKIAVQVFVMMGIPSLLGFAAGWVLDFFILP